MENICGKMRKRKKLNKKGSILDLVFIISVVLMFGIMMLIGSKVVAEFQGKLNEGGGATAEGNAAIDKMESHYSGVLDYSILFLAIGLSIGAFALASMVRIHPIFIPFYLIIMVVLIIIAGAASNIYTEMAANPLLSAQADDLLVISSILTYLPFLIGILATILMVVMYKLWDNSRI